jgi:hypothetical protein
MIEDSPRKNSRSSRGAAPARTSCMIGTTRQTSVCGCRFSTSSAVRIGHLALDARRLVSVAVLFCRRALSLACSLRTWPPLTERMRSPSRSAARRSSNPSGSSNKANRRPVEKPRTERRQPLKPPAGKLRVARPAPTSAKSAGRDRWAGQHDARRFREGHTMAGAQSKGHHGAYNAKFVASICNKR